MSIRIAFADEHCDAVRSEIQAVARQGARVADVVGCEAVRRGCTRALTSAWAFQGLRFWLARGYEGGFKALSGIANARKNNTYAWPRRRTAVSS